MPPGSQKFAHEPGRGKIRGARLSWKVEVLCDWGISHACPDQLKLQGAIKEVEGVPVEWLARFRAGVNLVGVAQLLLAFDVAPRVGQPLAGDAMSAHRASKHPRSAEVAPLSRAKEIP